MAFLLFQIVSKVYHWYVLLEDTKVVLISVTNKSLGILLRFERIMRELQPIVVPVVKAEL